MAEQEFLSRDVIKAAVAGEKWALERAVEHFQDYIDEQATVEKVLPDGTVKKEIDEDMRQYLIVALLEAIPQYPLDEPDDTQNC